MDACLAGSSNTSGLSPAPDTHLSPYRETLIEHMRPTEQQSRELQGGQRARTRTYVPDTHTHTKIASRLERSAVISFEEAPARIQLVKMNQVGELGRFNF